MLFVYNNFSAISVNDSLYLSSDSLLTCGFWSYKVKKLIMDETKDRKEEKPIEPIPEIPDTSPDKKGF